MVYITEVSIKCFKSIRGNVKIKNVQDKNNLVGLFDTIKTDLASAIIFALGASAADLRVNDLGDLKNSANRSTHVQLTFEATGGCVRSVRRELPGNTTNSANPANAQFLYIDSVRIRDATFDAEMEVYLDFLKNLQFDVQKQFMLYVIDNHKNFWHMMTNAQDTFIPRLINSTNQLRQYLKFCDERVQRMAFLDNYELEFGLKKEQASALETVLPPSDQNYRTNFEEYTTSLLRRQQAKRLENKAVWQTAHTELTQIINENETSQHTIDNETVLINGKVARNQVILTRIQEMNFTENEHVLQFKMKILQFTNSIKLTDTINENNRILIAELQRLKNSTEENIRFMRGHQSGTNMKSLTLTADALKKLYPVYHGSDELAMAKLQFALLKKTTELNNIKDAKEMSEYFHDVLPQRRMKQMDEPKDLRSIITETNKALKYLFHPYSLIQPVDDAKFEYLQSLIPEHKGFLVCTVFRATDRQHQLLIDHILCEYKYMVVLFKDEMASVSKMLIEKRPDWFGNVPFLVLSKLLVGKADYVPPPHHWLHLCTYQNDRGDDKTRRKLFWHMGNELKVLCVDTQDRVKQEFGRNSKKYVASIDGQLIYTRSITGIDVLMYFSPGEKVKRMQFPDASKRLEDAIFEIGKWMTNLTETEDIPNVINDDGPTALLAEVDTLEQKIAQEQIKCIDQMESLRRTLNQPYEVSDEQNYSQALMAESQKLNDIITRINDAQKRIADYEAEQRSWQVQISMMTEYIQLKAELDTNKKEIIEHKTNIKENKSQIRKRQDRKAKLELETEDSMRNIRNAKYETIRTVLLGNRAGVNWANIEVEATPTPPTLWQDIENGTFVDPMTMSIHFDDMDDTFNPDVSYVSEEWFNKLVRCNSAVTSLDEKIRAEKTFLQDKKRQMDELRPLLSIEFLRFNEAITRALNDIGRAIHPNENVVYDFKYDFKRPQDLKSTVGLTIDESRVLYESLSRLHQERTKWVVFAAFHRFLSVPFLYVDFSDVTEEIVNLVGPILDIIGANTQLFINSSHIHHIKFASLQFGFNKNFNTEQQDFEYDVEVGRHDGLLHVMANRDDREQGGHREQDERMDERVKDERMDERQQDERMDER